MNESIVKLVKATAYDGATAYEVQLGGTKVGLVVQREERTPIMARDRGLNYAVGHRRRMVWRIEDFRSTHSYRTRQDAVDAVVASARRTAEIELLSLEARRVSDRMWERGVEMADEEYTEASVHLARTIAEADQLIATGHRVRLVVKARLDRARQAIAGPRQQPHYFPSYLNGGDEAIRRALMDDRDARV